jgi:hypothetical protein
MNSSVRKKALTKAVIYWKDEFKRDQFESMTYYSLDHEKAIRENNYSPGLRRLIRKVVEEMKGRYRYVIIYHNAPNRGGEELARYNEEGKKI